MRGCDELSSSIMRAEVTWKNHTTSTPRPLSVTGIVNPDSELKAGDNSSASEPGGKWYVGATVFSKARTQLVLVATRTRRHRNTYTENRERAVKRFANPPAPSTPRYIPSPTARDRYKTA